MFHKRADHELSPVRMDACTLSKIPCRERLKHTPGLKWNSYIRSNAKDAAKQAGSLYCPKNDLLSNSISTKARSGQKWSIAAICGPELPITHFLAATRFKSVCAALWVIKLFHHLTSFPQTTHCSTAIFMAEF